MVVFFNISGVITLTPRSNGTPGEATALTTELAGLQVINSFSLDVLKENLYKDNKVMYPVSFGKEVFFQLQLCNTFCQILWAKKLLIVFDNNSTLQKTD